MDIIWPVKVVGRAKLMKIRHQTSFTRSSFLSFVFKSFFFFFFFSFYSTTHEVEGKEEEDKKEKKKRAEVTFNWRHAPLWLFESIFIHIVPHRIMEERLLRNISLWSKGRNRQRCDDNHLMIVCAAAGKCIQHFNNFLLAFDGDSIEASSCCCCCWGVEVRGTSDRELKW